MRLDYLIKDTDCKLAGASPQVEILALNYDSRCVAQGDCFIAVRGVASNGHNFIDSAIERGALAVVCEQLPETLSEQVCYVVVKDSNEAMAQMASRLYGDPSRKLKLVGITGTNGKTTVASLLHDMFTGMGYRAGLISTIVYRVAEQTIESTHTTPDTIRLNAMLAQMVEQGCDYCFMECSSHAMVQNRTGGLHFAGAVFTNITHDHLDYHKSFAEYIKAKKMLFDKLHKSAFAVVNIDDRNGVVMMQNSAASMRSISLRSAADYKAKLIEQLPEGMLLKIDGSEVWVSLLGRFNAYNLLTVFAVARELGVDTDQALRSLSMLRSVDGRFEVVRAEDGTMAIVDYAHTPDALESIIATIEQMRAPKQQIIVVCGCGGDRDRDKRPVMSQIATRGSDLAIFTADNPRSESAETILDEMIQGVEPGSRYIRITDRAEAIRSAAMMAQRGDIILIAGKGHEKYQIVGTERLHFDDKEQIEIRFKEYHSKIE